MRGIRTEELAYDHMKKMFKMTESGYLAGRPVASFRGLIEWYECSALCLVGYTVFRSVTKLQTCYNLGLRGFHSLCTGVPDPFCKKPIFATNYCNRGGGRGGVRLHPLI